MHSAEANMLKLGVYGICNSTHHPSPPPPTPKNVKCTKQIESPCLLKKNLSECLCTYIPPLGFLHFVCVIHHWVSNTAV